MTGTSQDEVIAFLSRPESYGPDVREVARVDTHISIVFLAGTRAYKLKRAVVFPYLDFSTAERRRRFCEAEVELNRRTAPELYEGVAAVTREDGGLALGGRGPALDYLVVMKRFAEENLFHRLADAGRLTPGLMAELAREIARFHREAPPRPDHGGRGSIARVLADNAESFVRHGAAVFDPALVRRLAEESARALDRAGELLEARRAAGYVRHCHGDLHLRNICLYEGRPLLFDAIEFSEEIACIDVLYDLAFLLMDLEARGLRALGNLVLNRYFVEGRAGPDDLAGLAALPLFLSCRAAVRAHVEADAARAQISASAREAALAEACAYLRLALELLAPAPPRLVAVGGLSGTGKSTLAQALAPGIGAAPGALVLRSDIVRKQICGVPELARLPQEAYRDSVTEQVYETIAARAEAALRAGHSVIADAVYARPAQRERLEALARACGVPFAGLWLEAPAAELMRRVAARGPDASDADAAVLARQLEYDLGAIAWRRIPAGGAADETLAAAQAALAA